MAYNFILDSKWLKTTPTSQMSPFEYLVLELLNNTELSHLKSVGGGVGKERL